MKPEFNKKINILHDSIQELKKYKLYASIGIILFPILGIILFNMMLRIQKKYIQQRIEFKRSLKINELGTEEYLNQIKKLLEISKSY